MKKINNLSKIRNFKNKTCFVYVDFNIKVNDNNILDDRKIREIVDTIEFLSFKNVKIVLFSDNKNTKELENILEKLKYFLKLNKKFDKEIILYKDNNLDNFDNILKVLDPGDIVCIKPFECYVNNDKDFKDYIKYFTKKINYFIFDNFDNFYFKNNFINILLKKIKIFYGYSFCEKYENYLKLKIGKNKNIAVVGGEYDVRKVDFIENLLKNKSTILLGGEVSAIFSYVYINRIIKKNKEKIGANSKIYNLLIKYRKNIILPADFLVGKNKYKNDAIERKNISNIKLSDHIFDIGPETIKKYLKYINKANVLLWSGLLGMVEDKKFSSASLMMAEIFCNKAKGKAFGVAIGNRTCNFVINNKYGDDVDYLFFEKQTIYNLIKNKN